MRSRRSDLLSLAISHSHKTHHAATPSRPAHCNPQQRRDTVLVIVPGRPYVAARAQTDRLLVHPAQYLFRRGYLLIQPEVQPHVHTVVPALGAPLGAAQHQQLSAPHERARLVLAWHVSRPTASVACADCVQVEERRHAANTLAAARSREGLTLGRPSPAKWSFLALSFY